MTTDLSRLRSEFINTKIITRNSAKQLGVIKELLVDIDRREVVALGLRDSMISLSGMPRYMYLSRISQIGDVILVEDEDVVEDVDIEAYSKLINSEVITEAGELLGRVRDFQFDLEDGKVSALIIASIGLPQIPDQVISTYLLPVEEIVSSGPNRLIVFEGSEDRISQLTVGVLERMGIGRPPWEREEEELYSVPSARPDNQLGTGIPVRTPVKKVETRATVVEDAWDEDDELEYVEAQPVPQRQAQSVRYREYEEDNWGDSERYEQQAYVEPSTAKKDYADSYQYDEMEDDVWDDDVKAQPYKAPRVNIPEKTKTPEYEEETNY